MESVEVETMKSTLRSDPAWIVLLGLAFTYNVLAARRGGELLSVGAQRYRAAHPVLVGLLIGATIGHLTGVLPRRLDVYHVPLRGVFHIIQTGVRRA